MLHRARATQKKVDAAFMAVKKSCLNYNAGDPELEVRVHQLYAIDWVTMDQNRLIWLLNRALEVEDVTDSDPLWQRLFN